MYTKIPITALSFDTTNPREDNKEVVSNVLLSLKKFGLVMPIIAFKDGVILGGHQRVKALRSDGQKYVYVNFIKTTYKAERITINMALNRVIQELDYNETNVQPLTDEDMRQINALEDVEDYALQMRNVRFGEVKIKDLNIKYTLLNLEKYLYTRGLRLPVLVNKDLEVIIGVNRAFFYQKRGLRIPYIVIEGKRGELIAKAIKSVSNKFEFNDKDSLRVSSRRHIINNNISGHAPILGRIKPEYNFSIYKEGVKRRLGNNILDFGSGNGKQSAYLRQSGVKITTFEPFVPTGGMVGESTISLLKTRKNYEIFLQELQKNIPFTTVIANAVLNSVAIKDDIYKVCYLLRVLAIGGLLFGSTRSVCKNDDNKKANFEIGNKRRLSIGLGKLKVQNFIDKEQLVEYMQTTPFFMKIDKHYLYYKVKDECMQVSLSYLDDCIDVEFCFNYGDRKYDFRDATKQIMHQRLKVFEQKGLCKLIP